MASTAFTAAGATIEISAGLPATYNAAGFAALTFSGIGEVTDIPEYSRVYNLVTHNPLADRRTVKRKGSFNDGSLTVLMALDRDDAGQVILQTALNSDNSFSFKITMQDGSIDYFTAQVLSYTTNIGTVDNIVTAAAQIEIDNDIVSV